MKNTKLYIIGAVMLISGLAIGWLVKPVTESTDHSNHQESNISSDASDTTAEIWTCSMHPQIRQEEFGICPICEMDLIPLDNSIANDDPTVLRMSQEAAKLAQVETFVVGGNIENAENQQVTKVDGTVELDERTIKSQTAHLPGRIEEMQVTFEGQYIKKGQKIATIYSTELLAASQELITAEQYNERIEGLSDAAKQKLRNWKITEEQIQGILESKKPIETIDIFAQHSGYVLSKKLSLGDYVKLGQPLYTVGSTSRLWLIFNVFESDLAHVRRGKKVVFTTPSLPNRNFTSTISYIDPLLNSTSRTATVRAEISNGGNLLKPGMLIEGDITAHSSAQTKAGNKPVIVPASSVLWTGNKSVVYVKVPDTEVPSFEFREVSVGARSGNYVTIISGINDGDEVVAHGAFAVDAAAQLNNNFSMMNRNVKIKKEAFSEAVPSFTAETPQAFKGQLDLVVSAYVVLKDALVATDPVVASSSAAQLLQEVEKVEMALLKGEAHVYWMEQLSAIKAHGDRITTEEAVSEQRNQFDFLSQAMVNSLKAFGTNEKTYYVQHCPMAKDNEGADWISEENVIRNPYFGDKMMKCGTVKLELK